MNEDYEWEDLEAELRQATLLAAIGTMKALHTLPESRKILLIKIVRQADVDASREVLTLRQYKELVEEYV